MKKLNLFFTLVALSLATSSLWAKPAVADANGKLPCQFSVSATQKVQFSQGNLQYNSTNNETQSPRWQFASEQYEYIGNTAGNTNITIDGIADNNGIADLFGWVGASSSWTGIKQYGLTSATTLNAVDGYGNNASENLKSDWGTTMGSGWRTLTSVEWTYLFNSRTGDKASTVNGNSNARYAKATVNSVAGIILFPDGGSFAASEFTAVGTPNDKGVSFTVTTCTLDQWRALEAKGCVFLPSAGTRYETTVTISNSAGAYWASSPEASNVITARYVSFYAYDVQPETYNGRCICKSVRLVQDASEAPIASANPAPAAVPDLVFTGSAQDLVTAGTAIGGTIMYSTDNGAHWSDEIPQGTAAGTYTVKYKVEGSGCFNDYTPADNTIDVTIAYAVSDNSDPSATLTTLYNGGSPAATTLKVERTIHADGAYNTICLPFNVTAEDFANSTYPLYGKDRLKAFKGATVTGSGQALHIDIFVEDVDHMDAGVPYLITYPADRGSNIVDPVFSGITVATTEPDAVSANGVTFQGMFAQEHIAPYQDTREQDFLFLGANNELYWPEVGDASYMRGFRAYFIINRSVISVAKAPKGTRARIMDAPKTTTGIDELNTTVCTKFIENGQLYIIKNGVKYNAQGIIVK